MSFYSPLLSLSVGLIPVHPPSWTETHSTFHPKWTSFYTLYIPQGITTFLHIPHSYSLFYLKHVTAQLLFCVIKMRVGIVGRPHPPIIKMTRLRTERKLFCVNIYTVYLSHISFLYLQCVFLEEKLFTTRKRESLCDYPIRKDGIVFFFLFDKEFLSLAKTLGGNPARHFVGLAWPEYNVLRCERK